MKEMEFDIASFREFKDSYKEEVIQNNSSKTKYEIDVILEEMYITYINKELNINVSTLKEANYRRMIVRQKWKYQNDPNERKARADRRRKKYYDNIEYEKFRQRRYYAANKEKVDAQQKEYRAANKEKIAAQQKERYADNKEKIAAQQKEYRAANKEKIAAQRKERYAANKEKIAAQQKEYRAANKEKINSRRRELRAKRKEEKNE